MNPTRSRSLIPAAARRIDAWLPGLAAGCLAFAALTPSARAANSTPEYFDLNGTTGAFGTATNTLSYDMGQYMSLYYGFTSSTGAVSSFIAGATGVTVGETVIGTGIPAGVTVTAVTGPTNITVTSFTPTASSSGNYSFSPNGFPWSSSIAGTAATTAWPNNGQMTFGTNAAGDASLKGSCSINTDNANDLNGIVIYSTNVNITLNGIANTHPNSTPVFWQVITNSVLTMASTRQAPGGFNCSGEVLTNGGGGTINWGTGIGCNDSAVIIENMSGPGTVNLFCTNLSASGYVSTYSGGFTLLNGLLNFASAQSSFAFQDFASGKNFTINGGKIDNTSGGSLTLAAMTNSGGIAIGGNFTFVGTTNLSLGSAPVTLNANAVITVNTNTLTIGGGISGGSGITVAGTGTLALTNVSYYSGNTVVNPGATLALANAATLASPVISLGGSTLNVSGLAAPFSPASGQTLALTASATVVGPVTPTTGAIGLGINALTVTGPLTLAGGTVSNTLSTTTNGNNGVLIASGGLILSNNTTIQITYTSLQTGRYKLITYTGTETGSAAANLTLSGFINSGRQTGALDDSIPGEIDLLVTGVAGNLAWAGDGSANNWDANTTQNWTNLTTVARDYFYNGDLVTFNDNGSENPANPVQLAGTLSPGSVLVTNSGNYVFSSYGSISGNATVTKSGSGSLTLGESGGDNFTGGIVVNGGTLTVADSYPTLAGGLTVNGGTAVLDQQGTFGGATTIASGGTVQVGNNDNGGILPSGTVTDNGSLILTNNSNLTVANVLTGSGALSQLDTNTVTLAATNSGFTGSVLISGGTVVVNNTNALGSWNAGAVTITNGGTLDLAGLGVANTTALFGPKQFYLAGPGVGGNGAIVNNGSLIQDGGIESITLTANSTIGGVSRWDMRSGTPTLTLNGFTLTKTNSGVIALVATHVTAGNIIVNQGDLSVQTTPVFTACTNTITANSGGVIGEYKDTLGSFTRSIVLNGGEVLNEGGSTLAYLDAPVLLTANSAVQNSGGTLIMNGIIADSGANSCLTNNGSGTNYLTATNTYTGVTLVTGVTLGLTNTGSINASQVIAVNGNGKFDLSGSAIPFASPNTLLVGDDTLGAGTLTLGTTLVTSLNYLSLSNAVVNLAVANPATPNITVTNLNLGDVDSTTINVTALPLGVPTQFPLIKYASVTGNYNVYLGTLPAGYSGSLVNNTGNNSIDLLLTGMPAGSWTGGSTSDSDWSDSANWGGTGLTGTDPLYFNVTARLNNTNDTTSPETASTITFGPSAGAFILNGNPVTILTGGIANNSAALQTINLGLTFATNITINGGAAGIVIGGGLTNNLAGTTNYTTVTLAGTGTLADLLASTNSPGGTNVLNLNAPGTVWNIADNPGALATTAPWALNIANGTLNYGSGSGAPNLTITAFDVPQDNYVGNGAGATGTLNFTNGTFTTVGRLDTALSANSTGVVNQVGGTLNIGYQFQGANGGGTNELSIVNLSGGTMNINAGTGQFYVASRGTGTLNLSGGTLTCSTLDVSRNASGNAVGSVGIVNLNGGNLIATSVGTATANAQTNTAFGSAATFNFNGGTLVAGSSTATFMQGSQVAPVIPLNAIVKAGGAFISSSNHNVTIDVPLQHDSTLGATADGGLVKLGTGTLILTNANTYTGLTVVSNGNLVVNGSIGAGAVTVLSGSLQGTGSVGGNATINGNIIPATAGNLGTFTVTSNLTLNGTATLYLNQSTATNDVLQAGTVTYGGTLTVTNLAGTPVAGNSFHLFNAGSYGGTFAATNLPPLGSGLGWNWNPAVGTLSVIATVNTTPTNLVSVVAGNVLTLSWPADHIGWRLVAQTNSISTGLVADTNAWFTVSGSTATNLLNITIDPSQGTVFYQMVYP